MAENSRLFKMMADQQKTLMEQVTASQHQANQHLWEHILKAFTLVGSNGSVMPASREVQPQVKVQKMITADDPKASLNAFVCTVTAAGLPEGQWVAMLIPCLVGPAQQAIDTLPMGDVVDYKEI